MAHRPDAPRAQRGLTLLELLVGLAVGLLVLAGACAQAMRQLDEGRRLLLETQVQQELRAAADVVLRDLRRAGHWGAAAQGLRTADGQPGAANPYADLSQAAGETTYAYARDAADNGAVDSADLAGFRLRQGVVEMKAGGAGWQALTDPRTVTVTQFELALESTAQPLPCPRACGSADTDCPPRLHRRDVALLLAGQAVHDAAVRRGLAGRVRLRNDLVTGQCPA